MDQSQQSNRSQDIRQLPNISTLTYREYVASPFYQKYIRQKGNSREVIQQGFMEWQIERINQLQQNNSSQQSLQEQEEKKPFLVVKKNEGKCPFGGQNKFCHQKKQQIGKEQSDDLKKIEQMQNKQLKEIYQRLQNCKRKSESLNEKIFGEKKEQKQQKNLSQMQQQQKYELKFIDLQMKLIQEKEEKEEKERQNNLMKQTILYLQESNRILRSLNEKKTQDVMITLKQQNQQMAKRIQEIQNEKIKLGQQMAKRIEQIQKEKMKIDQEKQRQKQKNQCVICLHERISYLNIKCNHICICEGCLPIAKKTCPLCKAQGKFKKVFLPM